MGWFSAPGDVGQAENLQLPLIPSAPLCPRDSPGCPSCHRIPHLPGISPDPRDFPTPQNPSSPSDPPGPRALCSPLTPLLCPQELSEECGAGPAAPCELPFVILCLSDAWRLGRPREAHGLPQPRGDSAWTHVGPRTGARTRFGGLGHPVGLKCPCGGLGAASS